MENRVKGIGKDSVIVSWLVSNASDSHIIFIFYFIPRNLLAFTFLSSFFFPQHSFGKQFYRSVSRSDYTTMRLGFIKASICPAPK
jgi:hypothetical protein